MATNGDKDVDKSRKWSNMIMDDEEIAERRGPSTEDEDDSEDGKVSNLKYTEEVLEMLDYINGLPYASLGKCTGLVVENAVETKINIEIVIPHTDEFVTAQIAELDKILITQRENLDYMEKRRKELAGRRKQ